MDRHFDLSCKWSLRSGPNSRRSSPENTQKRQILGDQIIFGVCPRSVRIFSDLSRIFWNLSRISRIFRAAGPRLWLTRMVGDGIDWFLDGLRFTPLRLWAPLRSAPSIQKSVNSITHHPSQPQSQDRQHEKSQKSWPNSKRSGQIWKDPDSAWPNTKDPYNLWRGGLALQCYHIKTAKTPQTISSDWSSKNGFCCMVSDPRNYS